MVKSCCAYKCSSENKKGSGLTFHRFPKALALRKQWILATCIDKWEPSSWSYLCSKHFTEDCFDRTGQTVRLKQDVVPNLFNFPSHLTKKSAKLRNTRNSGKLDHVLDQQGIDLVKDNVLKGIQVDHTYNVESPRNLKKKLDDMCNTVQAKNRKIKELQQTCKRLKKKCLSLTDILDKLRKEHLIAEELLEQLKLNYVNLR